MKGKSINTWGARVIYHSRRAFRQVRYDELLQSNFIYRNTSSCNKCEHVTKRFQIVRLSRIFKK